MNVSGELFAQAQNAMKGLPKTAEKGRKRAGRWEVRDTAEYVLDSMDGPEVVRDGYIVDFISGNAVKDGPEERDAVQVFAKMLVEDYGYPKTHIQTRPQYRVKARPSDTKKEYPVDIAVFSDGSKS